MARSRAHRVGWFALAAAIGSACADDPVAESACTEAEQAVNWQNWGAGFFAGYCRSCHSAQTPDRRGAPVGMDFDTAAGVALYREAIERSVVDEATMPWGGGLPSAERAQLQVFLRCSP